MKILFYNLLFLIVSINIAYSQTLIFTNDIAPIFEKKCISCHRPNNVAPIDFTNSDNIYNNKSIIKYVLTNKYMPPWKADTSCSNLLNNRSLSETEITTLLNWINTSNNKVEKTKLKIVNSFDDLGTPDLIYKINVPYKIKGNNTDDFKTFIIDLGLTKDILVKAIKVVPGNKKLVHHVRVEFDSSLFYKNYKIVNNIINTNEIQANEKEHSTIPGIGFYVPGLHYVKFPNTSNVTINKNMKMLLNIHYAPSSIDEYDQTEVYIYLDKSKYNNLRNVICTSKIYGDRSNMIPANSVQTIYFTSDTFVQKLSLFGIQPHMHLLGKSIIASLITPQNDTIKLIDIPNWDFNWQEFYFFDKMITIEKGTVLLIVADFDNTINNPLNPFTIPKDISFGEMKTSNEMLGAILLMLPYQQGDEVISLKKNY